MSDYEGNKGTNGNLFKTIPLIWSQRKRDEYLNKDIYI